MSITDNVNSVQEPNVDNGPLAWGVEEIGRVIGRTPRQTHHILTRGQIKSARKVGGKRVANREALIRELSGE